MEADLQIHAGVDYRDRWRRHPYDGSRLLTLRRLWVLIQGLPPQSRLLAELRDGEHWSLEAHLLDNIRMALVGDKKNPAKPMPGRFRKQRGPVTRERQKRIEDGRRRARARRASMT